MIHDTDYSNSFNDREDTQMKRTASPLPIKASGRQKRSLGRKCFALLATTVLALAVAAPADAQRKREKVLYSTVTSEDMPKLLRNVALVGYTATTTRSKTHRYALSVNWFDDEGKSTACFMADTDQKWYLTFDDLTYPMIDKEFLRIKYPLLRYGQTEQSGYSTVRYNAEANGAFSLYVYENKLWWERDVGHLQKRIPAAVYRACPDFPLATRLGARVNKAQTSLNYKTLIKQDPGERIIRPDLVTEDTVVRY